MLRSGDGLAWSLEPSNLSPTADMIVFRNGRYLAFDPASPGRLYHSLDALEWDSTGLPTDATIRDIAYGFGLYIAIGTSATGGVALFSEDAANWKELPGLRAHVWQGIACGHRGFNLSSRGGGMLRLDLSAVRARLAGQQLAGGQMSFNLLHPPGGQLQLYRSPDLDSWEPIRVIDVTDEVTTLLEALPEGADRAFWKVEPAAGMTP